MKILLYVTIVIVIILGLVGFFLWKRAKPYENTAALFFVEDTVAELSPYDAGYYNKKGVKLLSLEDTGETIGSRVEQAIGEVLVSPFRVDF